MRFDATGARLVSVARDRLWALWRAEGSSADDTLATYQLHANSQNVKNAHSRIIWACAWSPDGGSAFLTASRDKHIMAWSGETGELLAPAWSLPEPITAFDVGASIANSSSFFAAVGYEAGGLELLAISLSEKTCQSLFRMPADWSHMGLSVRRIALHPLDPHWVTMATAGDDGFVRIFKISPTHLFEALTTA